MLYQIREITPFNFLSNISSKAKTYASNLGLPGLRFPALRRGCLFSLAWHGLPVFPRLARVASFPALSTGCMFLLRVLIGSSFFNFLCLVRRDSLDLDIKTVIKKPLYPVRLFSIYPKAILKKKLQDTLSLHGLSSM